MVKILFTFLIAVLLCILQSLALPASQDKNDIFLSSRDASVFLKRTKRDFREECNEQGGCDNEEIEEVREWVKEAVKEGRTYEEYREYLGYPTVKPAGTTKSWWSRLWRKIKDFFGALLDALKFALKIFEALKELLDGLKELKKFSTTLRSVKSDLTNVAHTILEMKDSLHEAPEIEQIATSLMEGANCFSGCSFDATNSSIAIDETACAGKHLIEASKYSVELADRLTEFGEDETNVAKIRKEAELLNSIASAIVYLATNPPPIDSTTTDSPTTKNSKEACGVTLEKATPSSPSGTWPCQYYNWLTFDDIDSNRWDFSHTYTCVEVSNVTRPASDEAFNGKVGHFDDSSSVKVPIFQNGWFRSQVFLYARFKIRATPNHDGMEAIVKYGGNGDGQPSLLLAYHREYDLVVAKAIIQDSDTGLEVTTSISFKAATDEWIEAKATFDGRRKEARLEGVVGCSGNVHDEKESLSLDGRIKSVNSPLYIGGGWNSEEDCSKCCRPFNGYMDFVTLKMCEM